MYLGEVTQRAGHQVMPLLGQQQAVFGEAGIVVTTAISSGLPVGPDIAVLARPLGAPDLVSIRGRSSDDHGIGHCLRMPRTHVGLGQPQLSAVQVEAPDASLSGEPDARAAGAERIGWLVGSGRLPKGKVDAHIGRVAVGVPHVQGEGLARLGHRSDAPVGQLLPGRQARFLVRELALHRPVPCIAHHEPGSAAGPHVAARELLDCLDVATVAGQLLDRLDRRFSVDRPDVHALLLLRPGPQPIRCRHQGAVEGRRVLSEHAHRGACVGVPGANGRVLTPAQDRSSWEPHRAAHRAVVLGALLLREVGCGAPPTHGRVLRVPPTTPGQQGPIRKTKPLLDLIGVSFQQGAGSSVRLPQTDWAVLCGGEQQAIFEAAEASPTDLGACPGHDVGAGAGLQVPSAHGQVR